MIGGTHVCAVISRARLALDVPQFRDPGSRSGVPLGTKLAHGSIVAFGVHVTAAGLTYCAQLAVARTIGAHGYGVYAYVLAWVTVLAYISALGFDISLLRFVPAYLATKSFPLLRGVIRYACRRVAALGCCIGLGGSAVVLIRSGHLPHELVETFLVGFAVVPILALLWSLAAAVRGLGGVFKALAPIHIPRDGAVLAVMLSAAAMGWNIGGGWAMAAVLLGTTAGLALVSIAIRQLRPADMSAVAAVYDAQTWRRTALPLVVTRTAETLMNRTGVLVLGWLVSTSDAGIYALAFNLAFAATLPRTAINALLAPIMSDLFVRQNQPALRTVVTKSALWMFLGATSVAIPLLILAEPVLGLFGRDFVAGAPVLRILLVGQLIAAAAGSQLHLMNMTGHERKAAVLVVGSACGNALLGFALVPFFGPLGAALSATTALVGWNIAMAFSVQRQLRFLPGMLAEWRHEASRCARPGAAEAP